MRRGEDADSGEGASWIVLRHTQAEGLGLLGNVLRDVGIHHRVLDMVRGEAPPRDLRTVGWAPVRLTPEGKDDALLMGCPDEITVFHLHGDTYELPPDAENLATTPAYEQQAFRWGETVYGFQFHLEFTDAVIARLTSE